MVMGFSFAPVFASLISLTPGRVGLDHANAAIGFQIAAAGLGGATTTAVIGLLAGQFGLEAIGVALLVGALALLALYEAFMATELAARPRRPRG
jgi:fucose permease